MATEPVPRWRILPHVTVIAALILLGLGLLVLSQNERFYRQQSEDAALVQANVIAASVSAALDFDDRNAATEAISALRANPQIKRVAVYDGTGTRFATFSRDAIPLPGTLPRTLGTLEYIAPVLRDRTRIGSVYLATRAEAFELRLARYGLVALFVVFASLVAAVLAATQLILRRTNAALATSNAALTRQIAENAQVERQLRQAQKMESIGQLAGGIAHDFNNMLAIVLGNLDLGLKRIGSAPEKATIYVRNAIEGADRAAVLTRRLLAFARQQPLEATVVDVNMLVKSMSELLARTLGDAVVIRTELASAIWPVLADANQLENAIINLSVNARDAMPDGGTLTIRTGNVAHSIASDPETGERDFMCLSVGDTGNGIAEEVIGHVFEPFFTTKGVGKGTGLGLSQVYGFIKQSGGDVQIESSPGGGTVVQLLLPRHHVPAAIPDSNACAEIIPRARPGERVLVVEDEEQVGAITTEMLQDLGYNPVKAVSAAEAMTILATQPDIGLLFTDVMMPQINGPELARMALDRWPDLRVAFTSGFAQKALAGDDMAAETPRLLSKPFSTGQLARFIRAAFDGAHPAAG